MADTYLFRIESSVPSYYHLRARLDGKFELQTGPKDGPFVVYSSMKELEFFFPNPDNLQGKLGEELTICPECKKVCKNPTLDELGGLGKRGWFCSIECKVEYITPKKEE